MPSTTLRTFHWSSVNCCHPLAIHPLESMSAIIADKSTYSSKHKQYDFVCLINQKIIGGYGFHAIPTLHKNIRSHSLKRLPLPTVLPI